MEELGAVGGSGLGLSHRNCQLLGVASGVQLVHNRPLARPAQFHKLQHGAGGRGAPPAELHGASNGDQLGVRRHSDLGLLELIAVEASARSLIESFLERVELVASKRCRQVRSRLGSLLKRRRQVLSDRLRGRLRGWLRGRLRARLRGRPRGRLCGRLHGQLRDGLSAAGEDDTGAVVDDTCRASRAAALGPARAEHPSRWRPAGSAPGSAAGSMTGSATGSAGGSAAGSTAGSAAGSAAAVSGPGAANFHVPKQTTFLELLAGPRGAGWKVLGRKFVQERRR